MTRAGVIALSLVAALACAFPVRAEEVPTSDVTFADLFRASTVRRIDLSPTAEYVVYQRDHEIHVGNADDGYIRIYAFRDDESVRNLEWVGPNTLVLQTYNRPNGRHRVYASKVGIDDNGEFAVLARERHSVEGYIADPLLDVPEEIVFARTRREDKVTAADLFRINVLEESDRIFRWHTAVDTGSDEFYSYVTDGDGNYVLGMRYEDGVPEVWRRAGESDWRKVWVASKESSIRPFGLSADGRFLYALSNSTTDKMAAVAFDLEAGSIERVIYEHERFDLESILIDRDSQEPYGVMFTDQGLHRYHFFEDDPDTGLDDIRELFPGQSTRVVGRSSDNQVLLVHTATSKDRGKVHRCDVPARSCDEFVALSPWLEGKTLSDTEVLAVDVDDGLTVDAFVTLPVAGGPSIPLIVMPHGGPIGVRDSRYYSGDVQWLAHNGYAVLQVNYRGSSGYGKAFREAGLREWGRGIEDDIDTAVEKALATYPQLDRARIGIFGASYGGYSALMSIIRSPDLYRCAASFAGVTDLTLMFAQTRLQANPALREELVRIVGDPELDFDEQRDNSPVYRYREIERPVFLAHGTDDLIVDIEHSWRLRALLRLRGFDPEFVVIDDVGHGFDYIEEAEKLYRPLMKFLDTHLMQEAG